MGTLQQIKTFVLTALRNGEASSFTALSAILKDSPFESMSINECWEISDILENEGLVKVLKVSAGPSLRITLRGKEHLDKHAAEYLLNDPFSKSEAESLSERIDQLFEKLSTLGNGQEILFDEITELKKLLTVLNKKDWKSLLKGKLIEMGFGELTEAALTATHEAFNDTKFLGS